MKGQAKEVANQVSTADKKKDDGLEILLGKLDEAFLKEPEKRKFMVYQDFEECVRKEEMLICDFMREFDTKYFKMKEKGMELPDEVLAFRLVKICKLTEVQREQVMASTKPLSFKEVRATLKRMFESSSGSGVEMRQEVKVKEEPIGLYVKATDKQDISGRNRIEESNERGEEEDVMWASSYRNQSNYRPSRNWNRRYNRNRYSRRNWRRLAYDNSCFECGSKHHWARDCEKRKEKEIDNKEL